MSSEKKFRKIKLFCFPPCFDMHRKTRLIHSNFGMSRLYLFKFGTSEFRVFKTGISGSGPLLSPPNLDSIHSYLLSILLGMCNEII